ncbi:hypothetical protein TPSea814_000159a [Treponema pallidum subsp. pallidum str. Sea 81-4]|nr:hypothetical protein TPChic_0159a [Treponema pallidum subsp. pallidum str. Chicago]AHN66863.1 hypothetical protein TPSea814_000159a [Treponema pallidum subsp. pallidum str. Sea 81-4]
MPERDPAHAVLRPAHNSTVYGTRGLEKNDEGEKEKRCT